VQIALMNVRFEGKNGHDAGVTRCPLMTHTLPMPSELIGFSGPTVQITDA
jgi:hypothetical protein